MKKFALSLIMVILALFLGLCLSGTPKYVIPNIINIHSDIYRVSTIMDLLLFAVCAAFPLIFIIYKSGSHANLLSVGKAMAIGSLIALAYDFTDLYFIKNTFYRCSDWCGIENFIFGFIPAAYLVLALLLLIASNFVPKKSTNLP